MNKIEQQLKDIYTNAGDKLSELVKLYVEVEELMHSDAEYSKKMACYEKTINNLSVGATIEKNTEEEISKVCDSKTRKEVLENNQDVKDAYNYYLWQKEEVDYMLPHAKGALDVFARDMNVEELAK